METVDTRPDEVVVVALGACRYALPLPSVAEVGRPTALTRVPGLPDWVAGVTNWRGRVLAVIDVRGLLTADAAPLDRRGRLVVLSRGSVTVGLLTERVEGTAVVSTMAVEAPLAHLPATAAALLNGQVTDAGGPIGLLDLDAVFGLADALPRPRRASA